MKFHYSTFILAFLLILGSYGKMNAQEEVKKGNYIHKANSIFFAPFNILDFFNPSFQVGYERMIHSKWALQFEYGYIFKKTIFDRIVNPKDKEDEYNNKGYKLRTEVKYFIKKETNFGLYTSLELFYMRNTSGVNGTFVVSDTSINYSFKPEEGFGSNINDIQHTEYYTNDKTKYGINAKFGVKVFPGSFLIESYLGLGIAHRKNKHSDRENINDKEPIHETWDPHLKGEMWIFNLPINVKVGYRF